MKINIIIAVFLVVLSADVMSYSIKLKHDTVLTLGLYYLVDTCFCTIMIVCVLYLLKELLRFIKKIN